ncbi:hypothetical protein [Caudoviricetes sp.]|nr:hypothetical protein [Caudoviricetes sp.]
MTSDNGRCPTMDLEGKPNTPKYEIGSLWKNKSDHGHLVFTLKEKPYCTGNLTLTTHCLDSSKHTYFRNLDEIEEDFEPYTENQWNDYNPNVEPEIGKWIEWSKNTHEGHASMTLREEKLYRLLSKQPMAPWKWQEFERWGQWRYCDAPDINVVTKTEPVENEENHTVEIGQKWKSKANRLVYEIADLKHDSNKDEWEVFIKTTQHPYGSWIMVHALVSDFTYEGDSKDEEKNTLTAEQFLKFAEAITTLRPRAETINYEEWDKEADRLGLARLPRIVNIPDGVVTEDILKSHPNGTMFRKRLHTEDWEKLYPIKRNVQNMHNDHYTKLGDYEPFKVFEAFVEGNKNLFESNPSLSGYYLQAIKYLGRINSKDAPVKNLEKAIVYIQEMIKVLQTE